MGCSADYGSDPGNAIRVDDGEWHHIAYTYNDGQVKTYTDGVFNWVYTNPDLSTKCENAFISNHNDAAFNYPAGGDIDEFLIYSKALSEAEVNLVMQATSTTTTSTISTSTLSVTSSTETVSSTTATSTISTSTLTVTLSTETATSTTATSTISTSTLTATSSFETVSSTATTSTISTSTFTVTSSIETVSSTTATSTISTSTLTATSSTETEPQLSCTLTHMVCPVPDHLPGSSYVILGNESSQEGPCAIQGGGDSWWFEIPFHACNVSHTFTPAHQTHVATLVPNISDGDLLLQTSVLPAIVCRCEHPMVDSASAGVEPQLEDPAAINSTAASNFSVELFIYVEDTFEEPITPGEAFPPDAARIYIEAQSANPDDVIGFLSCSASPTGEAGDPYTHEFLRSSCPAGGLLDWQGHADDSSSVARSSVLTFQFAGSPAVFITCAAIRCSAEPCGQCLDTSRRLNNSTRQLTSPISTQAQAEVSFQLQAGSVQVVLPSNSSAETLVSAWSPADSEEDAWLSAMQQMEAPIVIQSTFTLYGCGIKDAETFANTSRNAIADWVAVPKEHVRIVGVSLVRSAGSIRRLQAQADGVMVDFEILLATDNVDQLPSELTNTVQVDAGSSVLVIALRDELDVLDGGDLATVYIVHSTFLVEPSAPASLSSTTELNLPAATTQAAPQTSITSTTSPAVTTVTETSVPDSQGTTPEPNLPTETTSTTTGPSLVLTETTAADTLNTTAEPTASANTTLALQPNPQLVGASDQTLSASMGEWIVAAVAIPAAVLAIIVVIFLCKACVRVPPKLSTELAAQPHHGAEAEVHGVQGGQEAESDIVVDFGSGSGGGNGDIQAESDIVVDLVSSSGEGNGDIQDRPDQADADDADESANCFSV